MLAHERIIDFVLSVDQDYIVHGVPRFVTKLDWSTGSCVAFTLASVGTGNAGPHVMGHASNLVDLICPFKFIDRLRILRLYASLTGCNYLKFKGHARSVH